MQVYMAEYLVLSDVHMDPTGCARAWMYIGMAMKLAHSVSLARSSSCLSHSHPTIQMGLREYIALPRGVRHAC